MNALTRQAQESFPENPHHYDPVQVAREIAIGVDAVSYFGGDSALEMTASTLSFLDTAGENGEAGYGPVTSIGGVFTSTDAPTVVQEVLPVLTTENWLKGFRPSLTGLATALLKDLDIDIDTFEQDPSVTEEEKALTRAILMLSLRAEYIKGEPRGAESWRDANKYHNAGHVLTVTAMSHYLFDLTENDARVRLLHADRRDFTRADRLDAILRAVAHDLDHCGKGNPQDDRVYNERLSIERAKPLLKAAGVSKERIEQFDAAICATSPNGMIAALKQALEEINKEEPSFKRFAEIAREYPELEPLVRGDDLALIQKNLEMAAILNDADLFCSAGCGMDSSRFFSDLLTQEVQASGVDMDFTTDEARKFFLENIVGKKGFGSQAGVTAFNESFYALLAATYTRLNIAPKHAAYDTVLADRLAKEQQGSEQSHPPEPPEA